MKTMKKLFSMAALALVGATFTGCSSDSDGVVSAPQQPAANMGNVEILTTTVSLGDATTRALTDGGVKTFAAGETMALVYKNTGGSTVKVVSEPLPAGDHGKSATFTFTLTDPDKEQDVTYIYPAAMANDDGTVNYDALNSQDGTLTSLAANLDYCTKSGAWDGGNLPTLTLENQLAILAVTLKNEAGTSEITSSTKMLTVSDGINTYNVNRSAAAGPIYVAIRPTTSATINIEAINGDDQGYCKTLTTKTYEANNGYPVSWKMTPAKLLSTIISDYTAPDGETLYGKLGSNVKISIAGGATVTLKDVTINGVNDGEYKWAGITCEGDATITLEGTNAVKGFDWTYPGIYVPENKTLTIQGDGSLNASSNRRSTGIGGGMNMHCGNIVINGGNITATGGMANAGIGGGEGDDGSVTRCGKITINGGTVTAMGGTSAAGIGGGYYGASNDITINGGTVTATGGRNGAGIGSGRYGTCGNITISGGTVTATGVSWAAGIGGGMTNGTCGTITITSGVTQVTATRGEDAPRSIGAGDEGAGISVTIEEGANVIQK